MISRSVRIALLGLAAWAIVFAPAAAIPGAAAPIEASPEDVAAAIVAPTFGPDGMVLARTARHTVDDLDADVLLPFVLVVAVVVGGAGLTAWIRPRTGKTLVRTLRCSLPTRAPPMA